MSGFHDDAIQYAEQNRGATQAEAAAIERLTAPPADRQHANEVERLIGVNARNSPKPSVKKHVSPKVQRALDILRHGL